MNADLTNVMALSNVTLSVVAFMDVSGLLEKEIFSLAGDFEESGESLHFGSGKIHVHLDEDSCNNDDSTSAKGCISVTRLEI